MKEIKSDKDINDIILTNKHFLGSTLNKFKIPEEIIAYDYIERTFIGDNLLVIHYKGWHKCLVIDNYGNIIIPIDTYSFIDGFTRGLAKVSVYDEVDHREKYGIIDVEGNIVFPMEYDSITRFYKDFSCKPVMNFIYMEKDEKTFTYNFETKVYHEIVPFWETEEWLEEERQRELEAADEERENAFSLYRCHDSEGDFDNEKLEDAIISGEYVPEDW